LLKLSATITITTYKIRIAKLANCRCAIFFSATPQITSGKTTKDRGSPAMRALALKSGEKFFNGIHSNRSILSALLTSRR
jgi:hypothetical protein